VEDGVEWRKEKEEKEGEEGREGSKIKYQLSKRGKDQSSHYRRVELNCVPTPHTLAVHIFVIIK
jgi:hypothetical protein